MRLLSFQSRVLAWAMLLTTAASDACQPCACHGNRMDCSDRGLSAVPSVFPNFTVWLDLSRNKITTVGSGAFLGLSNLTHLDISRNAITNLSGSAFIGLSELIYLNLDENPISYISGFADDVFLPLIKLKELYLITDDCPQQPPDKYVYRLAELESLTVVLASGGRIGNTLGNLRRLETLVLTGRSCPVSRLNESEMRTIAELPLRRLSLRGAGLDEVNPIFLRFFNKTLTKFDLSCNPLNNLPAVIEALRDSKIETLLLDNAVRDFTTVAVNAAFFEALASTPLKVLSVSRNLYLELDFGNISLVPKVPNLRYLRIAYTELIIHTTFKKEVAFPIALRLLFNVSVFDIRGLLNFVSSPVSRGNDIYCRLPDTLFSDDKQPWESDVIQYPPPKLLWLWLLEASVRFFLTKKWTLPPVLTRVYVSNLGIYLQELMCDPEKIYFKNNVQILDFSGTSIANIECAESGLSSARDINLGQTGLRSFDSAYFSSSSMPQLSSLNLSGNALGPFIASNHSNEVLPGMNSIRSLDLSANGIVSLPNNIFCNLNNISHINLSRNSISTWDATIISLPKLRVLDLTSNLLTTLTKTAMEEFDSQVDKVTKFVVNMSSNPFPCSCDNIGFLRWLTETSVIHNVGSCSDGNAVRILETQLLRDLEWQCKGVSALIICLSVTTILSVAAIVAYVCRWRLRYTYYKCRRFTQNRSVLSAHEIGVYLSYHENDADAAKRLCAYLESQNEIGRVVTRHCVNLGRYELEQMAVFIDECGVVVVLISPESLSDSKNEFELYMALEKGVQCVLPILTTESLIMARLPRALRKVLMSNCYLRLPSTHCDDNNSAREDNARWQRFLLIFEAWLLSIIEKQASLVPRDAPRTHRQDRCAAQNNDDEALLNG